MPHRRSGWWRTAQADGVEADAGLGEGRGELGELGAGEIDFLGADVVVQLAEAGEAVDFGLQLGGHRFFLYIRFGA